MKSIFETISKIKNEAEKKLQNVYNLVDASKTSIELFSLCEIEKIRLYNEVLKKNEVELLPYLESVLKEEYFYHWVDSFKNIKGKTTTMCNYVHKESESYRLSEALKLIRIITANQEIKKAESLKLDL